MCKTMIESSLTACTTESLTVLQQLGTLTQLVNGIVHPLISLPSPTLFSSFLHPCQMVMAK